jgi:hypothetical protein
MMKMESILADMLKKSKRYWMNYKRRLRKAILVKIQAEWGTRVEIIIKFMPKTQT